MLKRIIGAAIGAKLAKNSPAVGGATGAALGAAVPWVIGRLSLPGMIALAAGGYVAKRYMDRRETAAAGGQRQLPSPAATKPVPVASNVDY
ncbi:hypothetical protein ACLBKU_12370 [Erythrobacter sp. NE805]|uniref:hypothetical protein n=1 Tax=Erythrobacter sp. NE805 TaxID=3389875 RepID=UPI00396B0F68